ncbi:hypothetical protein AQI95_15500 [Streptomyces yokosukanensis]|uniref:Uncharacterized protein n=1 Tax=Streptomyces yokosukanensis TaxID=67386 RepID=A0A101P7C9_9ACTN|nr:hypothetical protein AQI95_15500 [Streptomyces yokosukanensis]
MVLDRLRTQHEAVGDLAVGQPAAQEFEDFTLTLCEPCCTVAGLGVPHGAGREPAIAIDDGRRHGTGHRADSGRCLPDCVREFVGGHVFEQIADGSLREGPQHVRVGCEAGHYDDGRRIDYLLEATQHREAVHVRHPQVEQDDVHGLLSSEPDRLPSATVAHHPHIGCFGTLKHRA